MPTDDETLAACADALHQRAHIMLDVVHNDVEFVDVGADDNLLQSQAQSGAGADSAETHSHSDNILMWACLE